MKILNAGILLLHVLLILVASSSYGVEQLNPKKMLSATDRSEEQHIQEKINFENKRKALRANKGVSKINTNESSLSAVSQESEIKSVTEEAKEKNKEPKAQESSENQVLVCKSGQEERSLELAKKGSGCEVIYTKQGSPKIIAQQRLGTLRCDDVFHTLQTKLAKGGFNCESK